MRDKEEEIVFMMKERNLEILGVCETRTKNEGQKKIHEDFRYIFKGNEEGRHGVGFVLNSSIAERVSDVIYKNERIISISLDLVPVGISFIMVYVPQQGRSVEEKEEFYNALQETYDSVKYRNNVIILGDWNGHVGAEREGIEGVLGAFSTGNRNAEGMRIIDFCVRNMLSVMNTFYLHKTSHKWTWYRWNEAEQRYTDMSMIDLFVTNNRNLFIDVKAVPSVSLDSDHRMVLAKIRIQKPKRRAKKKTKRLKIESLKIEEVKERLREKIAEKAPTSENDEQGVEEDWRYLKETVIKVTEEVAGSKIKYGTKKKCTAWWNPQVKEAVNNKMRAFRKWMKTRQVEDREAYAEERKRCEEVKRKAKEDVWITIGKDLMEDSKGTKKLLYSMAKNYKKGNEDVIYAVNDKDGNIILEPGKIADRWSEYFEELLNVEEEVEYEEHEEEQQQEVDIDDISTEEIISALKNMKNGKAPGDDEMPIEMIKSGGLELVEWLRKIFNKAWRTEQVPEDWETAIVCPIFKKGDKRNCGNYRGISLLSHVGKLYERILERKLRNITEEKLGNWQHGFRPERGTADLVFTLKIILEKRWEWNKSTYIAFIDLEKAFDRIDRVKLWQVIGDQHYSIPPKLIRVMKSLYQNNKSRIKNREIESRWFGVKTGVRQGGVLSPILFILYMDKCMREICTNEDKEITMTYADDVAIITGNQIDLQNAIDRWQETTRRNGLLVNVKKTEVMNVHRNAEECSIYINEQQLKQVNQFSYLGVLFTQDNSQKSEITKRIRKFNMNINTLYPLLKDKNVPIKCKTIIYTTILRPILTYGSETWSMTKKIESKIGAAEMKVLRLIKGVTRKDRIRNEIIRENLGIEPIVEIIERNNLRWYGHVKRMKENRYPRKYMEWQPRGRRPVGRPRKRWLEGVKKNLEGRNSTLEEVIEQRLYEDRETWRSLIKRPTTDR